MSMRLSNLPSLPPSFEAAASKRVPNDDTETLVVKFGGELAANRPALRGIAEAVIDQWQQGKPVVVCHGGGVQINEKLKTAGLPAGEIKEGVRATPLESIGTIRQGMDELNGEICTVINEVAHERNLPSITVGMGGYTDNLVTARTKPGFEGFATGEVASVDTRQLAALAATGIPVIHCICASENDGKNPLNVNADDVAAGIAMAMDARRLVYCTNSCVLDKGKQRISTITDDQVEGMIADGTLGKGMDNKVRACAEVVRSGKVEGVVILDAKNPQSLAQELQTESGAGTLILAKPSVRTPAFKPAALSA